MKKNVHIIPHVHWDREWYFSDEESKILLLNNLPEILTMLEKNDAYPFFLLDGQTAILEDYLFFKPSEKERIKTLVEKGKLIIGPWYTQTDEMVVDGESIVRNLLYGFKDCKGFGNVMKIGYLPDSFGQSARIPQILQGFGIRYCIFWRGISERMGTDKTEFYWEDDEGSKVIVQLLPLGYAIGKYLPDDIIQLKERLDTYFEVLDKGATTNNIVLPNGHDQMPIQKNILDIIDILKENKPEYNFFLSKYENVFYELEKLNSLATVKGEFLDGKYMRVHRSIFSTRADIKSYNTMVENKITNILEPLAAIGYSLGFNYESEYIESIWRTILKNHAHDSIGCCCSDKVHKIIKNRFFLAEESTDNLIDFYKRKIVDAMESKISIDKVTAFNLLPYDRNTVIECEIITKMNTFMLLDKNEVKIPFEIISVTEVDAGIIDRQIVHYENYEPFKKYVLNFKDIIPAMGYKTYFIKEHNIVNYISKHEEVNIMENSYYKINVEENGSLTILDKINETTYKDVMVIEDGSDDGDEYDYSPLKDDLIIYSKSVKAKCKIIKHSFKSVATIEYSLQIPKDINSRKNIVLDGHIGFSFNIILENDSPFIKISLTIDNYAKDHRVRLLLPNNISSKFSIADNQFGMIKREVTDNAMNIWEKENWKERPDAIYPMLNYVKMDTKQGLTLLTNSIREYEVTDLNKDTIAITIFRSIGFLGKEDLLRRPGRPSGIKLETPDSQMIGRNKYEFAITRNSDYTSREAKEYLTPIITYNKMPFDAIKLNPISFNTPYEYSLWDEKNKKVTLSAFKKAEYKDGFVIRCFNGTCKNIHVNLNLNQKSLMKTNLNEDIIEEINNTNNILIEYNEVQTYYIEKTDNLL